ncbi:hypothetical protein P7C70_g8336, partial [Phenoliferia sp. Uapishka_3]
ADLPFTRRAPAISLCPRCENEEQVHLELLEGIQSLPELVAIQVDDGGHGARLTFHGHWSLVEKLANTIQVLELDFEVFDGQPPTAPVQFPNLRKVTIQCIDGIPSSILSRLRGSPVMDVTCQLDDLESLDTILDAFPDLRYLTITRSRRHGLNALEVHHAAATCLKKGINLVIKSPAHPSLRPTDFLTDLPTTLEAAEQALRFAASERTGDFRDLRRRRLELEGAAADLLELEEMTLEDLEDLRLAWMD